MADVAVGGVLPRRDPDSCQMRGEAIPRNVQERPHPGTVPGRHPRQSRRTTPSEQPKQDGLGLIVGMMREDDHRRAGLGRQRSQRLTTREPRLGLGRRCPELERGGDVPETASLGRRHDGRCHRRTLGGDAVIDVGHQQVAMMDRDAAMEQIEESQRIGTAGDRE